MGVLVICVLVFSVFSYFFVYVYLFLFVTSAGHAVAQLVQALRYKPEGRGFDSRWCHWIFFR